MGWGGWTAAQAFMLFHDLMLLYPGGYAVFFGKTSMAEPYFSALGFDHPKVRLRPPGQPRSAAGKERAHIGGGFCVRCQISRLAHGRCGFCTHKPTIIS